MNRQKPENIDFTEEEAKNRFDAALRGSRIAGHKPMTDVSPKRPKVKRKTKKKK